MNYKFKIGDVVCPKIDYAEYKEKHFLCPRNLFIITDYVETSKDEYLAHNERRKILLRHGYVYVVRQLIEDCGSADIAFKKEYSVNSPFVITTKLVDELLVTKSVFIFIAVIPPSLVVFEISHTYHLSK